MPSDSLDRPTQASRLNNTPGVSMLPVGVSNSDSSLKMADVPPPRSSLPVRPQRLPENQGTWKPVVRAPAALVLLTVLMVVSIRP